MGGKYINIAGQRLYTQSLSSPGFRSAFEAVNFLGAVQAQDFNAAKWALGLRVKGATDVSIEKSFNSGEILRAHVMRPTWHFVPPRDLRWMQKLTSPRVKALLLPYDRKLGITGGLLSRCRRAVTSALKGKNFMPRTGLADRLAANSIKARGQKLAHIIMHFELEGLICSGPKSGSRLTYALLDERVPSSLDLNRDESLAKLALKYFTSHGPAQVKDFAWWSGLSQKDALSGLESVKKKLAVETEGGAVYYSRPNMAGAGKDSAYLLSIYDEYVIAYRDRSALGGERYVEKLLAMGNALTAVFILSGKIAGTWKRTIKEGIVEVLAAPLRKLSVTEKKELAMAAKRYGKFLGLPAVLRLK